MPKSSIPKKSAKKRSQSPDVSRDSSRKLKRPVDRKFQALRRLGISASDLAKSINISSDLKEVLGSHKKIIETMRFSQDQCIDDFFAVYDNLPVGDRDLIPIEAIAIKASVSLSALYGATLIALRLRNGQKSAMLAMKAHPEVLRKTIQYAKLPGGERDRRAIDTAVGFLPTSKGTNISFNMLNGVPQLAPPKEDSEDDDDGFAEMFPSITSSQEEFSEDRRKLLSDGK
jgi:hypothetical protein